MIRIRRISNPYLEVNLRKVEKVKEIILFQFPVISRKKIEETIGLLINPLKYKYQTALFIAEDIKDVVKGFAILLYFPDIKFCYLDYLAVSPKQTTSGFGGPHRQKPAGDAFGNRVRLRLS